MSIFEELFSPSARFREEEKRRLEWMRDEEGEGDPFRGPIDLISGKVRIQAVPKVAVPAELKAEDATEPRVADAAESRVADTAADGVAEN